MFRVTVLPGGGVLEAAAGEKLLSVLIREGLSVDVPCGGEGKCGKCRVTVDGQERLACRTSVDRDMTVTLPGKQAEQILAGGAAENLPAPGIDGTLLAFDIGTTTVVGYLLDGMSGQELASESRPNPQRVFGGDVVSRIRHALQGEMEALTGCIRACLEEITRCLCQKTGVQAGTVKRICVVGNPAMQQLFLGISPENLAKIPFAPVLTRLESVDAGAYLPIWENAELLIVPDISGFVGADTVGCLLATGMDRSEKVTLLVDIGTNGEMVLGCKDRMVACSTAAGPALEGANITFGMRGQAGAIDHVWLENGEIRVSVIGGGEALGICGSGLIDAVAAGLDLGLLDQRGRIQNSERILGLTDKVWLTQEDIREVQLAKGAIAAGIELMAAHLGLPLEDVDRVCLAGAFGTFLNPAAACRIGLLPQELAGKIRAVGNAAGSGAKRLVCCPEEETRVRELKSRIECLELAAAPGFQRCFARNMRFDP